MSDFSAEAGIAARLFLLEPVPETDHVAVAEAEIIADAQSKRSPLTGLRSPHRLVWT